MSTTISKITGNDIKEMIMSSMKKHGAKGTDFEAVLSWADVQSDPEHKEAIVDMYNKYKDSKYAK